MFDFVENNFDSLLRHVEQYYDFKQILVKVCSRASYARDQITSKIRASCEQDSIISRADREHTCARDRDLIASKCIYDSEPHCSSRDLLCSTCTVHTPFLFCPCCLEIVSAPCIIKVNEYIMICFSFFANCNVNFTVFLYQALSHYWELN